MQGDLAGFGEVGWQPRPQELGEHFSDHDSLHKVTPMGKATYYPVLLFVNTNMWLTRGLPSWSRLSQGTSRGAL